jgi:hypothetical protein
VNDCIRLPRITGLAAALCAVGASLLGVGAGIAPARVDRSPRKALLTYFKQGSGKRQTPLGLCLARADGSHRVRLMKERYVYEASWAPGGRSFVFYHPNPPHVARGWQALAVAGRFRFAVSLEEAKHLVAVHLVLFHSRCRSSLADANEGNARIS